MLSSGADGGIEDRRHEERAQVLRILQGPVPGLDDEVGRCLGVFDFLSPEGVVTQGLAVDDFVRVDRHEQVQNRPVARQRRHRIDPLGDFLLLAADRRSVLLFAAVLFPLQQFGRVKGRRVGDDRLGSLDDLSVPELDAVGPVVFIDEDLFDVAVEDEVHAMLFAPAVKGFGDVLRSSEGHRVGALLLEEALEDVEQVGRHGALGREPAEDAHEVDEVS
mmetsp:Transcript_5262/g.17264  ORF Transcript_5262/g.17264 Transcript_5262/m.17264 type:complete len:219 (+) Transcript_5262:734-1390(+)